LDRVAPFVAIEISVRSSFIVNRPGLLPTTTWATPVLDIRRLQLPDLARPVRRAGQPR
jgi:hypothetical protein